MLHQDGRCLKGCMESLAEQPASMTPEQRHVLSWRQAVIVLRHRLEQVPSSRHHPASQLVAEYCWLPNVTYRLTTCMHAVGGPSHCLSDLPDLIQRWSSVWVCTP